MDNDEQDNRSSRDMDANNLGENMFGLDVATAAVGAGLSLFKKKKKKKKISTLSKEQEALHNDNMAGLRGQGPLADLYSYNEDAANSNFDKNVSRPANRNFQENIIPQITGQFRQNNLQNSSYTGEALSRAGRNVQENLDAQRSNMIFNGQQNAQEARRTGINNSINTQTFAYQKPGKSTLDNIISSVGPQAAESFSDYLNKK